MNVAAAAVKTPLVIAMLAAIALSSSGAAVAHADPTGDFLALVRSQGIGVGRPDGALIEDAKEVCDLLVYQDQVDTYLTQNAGLDQPHAALFLRDAVTYYCPEFAFKLPSQ